MIAARALLLIVLGAWGCGRNPPAASESGSGAPAPAQRPPQAGAEPSRDAVSVGPAPGGAVPGSPGSAAPGSSPVPAAARAPVSAAEPRTGAACRVMRVTGDVRRDGAPLGVGTRLDGAPALELAAKASLHLVHTQSTRQWVVTGPARLVACDAGAEELALAQGQLRLEPGSGVRPGAEVWIGTPFGSLRYTDARAEIGVGVRELSLRVSGGELWFAPLGGESGEERRLAAGHTRFAAVPYRLASDPAVERCGRDAALASARAQALLAPLSVPLGQLAAEHVRARQRAHASCSSARAATLAATPDRDQEAGSQALARYDQLWRGVPGPRSAP